MGWQKGRPNLAKRTPLEVRFWRKVDKRGPNECWEWLGAKTKQGYGVLYTANGFQDHTHRIALRLHGVAVPEGGRYHRAAVVHHKCKNRGCCNPAHLELVTQYENSVEPTVMSPFAINARKTECLRGHPFNEENTLIDKRGNRQCIPCQKVRYAAKRAALNSPHK